MILSKFTNKNVAQQTNWNFIQNEGFVTNEDYKLTIEDLEMINNYYLSISKYYSKERSINSWFFQVFIDSKDNLKLKNMTEF